MKAVACALVIGTVIVAASAAAAASLRVVSRSPLVVAGTGFSPGERVTVTAVTGLGPRTTRVVATAGRFRVTFRLPTTGCGAPFAVRAIGSAGTRVTMKLGKAAVCVPPPRD
jgi:hypothetical protein